MITLNDVNKWVPLSAGEMIEYPSDRPRPVSLDVNTSGPAIIMIQLGQEEPRLLALVTGRETLKFAVPGPYAIMHRSPDEEVYILTADGSKVHREQIGDETFTQLHERRARNPELEYMMYTMERNFQRRMKAQEAQLERRYQADVDRRASDTSEAPAGGKPVSSPPSGDPADPAGDPKPEGGKAGSGDEKS